MFWFLMENLAKCIAPFLLIMMIVGLFAMTPGCDVRVTPNASDEVFCVGTENSAELYCCREFAITRETDCWEELASSYSRK